MLQEQETLPRNFFTVSMDGRTFILEMVNGQPTIVRLVSPDPSDYLRADFQPGQTLCLSQRNSVR